MATITAAQAGNWSATTTWDGGVVPGDGDIANLADYVVTQDILRLPASGALAQMYAGGTAGHLLVPMDVLGDGAEIHCDEIAGTGGTLGIVQVTGAAPGDLLTINGNVTAGTSASNARGVNIQSTCDVAVNGNVSGSSSAQSRGVQNDSTGTVTINGNVSGANGPGFWNGSAFVVNGDVTGGGNAANNSQGIFTADAAGTINGDVTGGSVVSTATGVHTTVGVWNRNGAITLNGAMVSTAQAVAWLGRPPTWTPTATQYAKWGAVYLYDETLRNADPGVANVKDGEPYKIFNVDKTGTFTGGGIQIRRPHLLGAS